MEKNFNYRFGGGDLSNYITVLVAGIFIWLIADPLFQDGMFMDGIVYASVARNLSMGIGTWLEPHYSTTLFDHYHEQPPLMIWMQSLFFTAFGDSIYPERIYCFVMGVITMILIIGFWRFLFQDSTLKQLSWLPVLLWLMVPTISWGLINNVEENTMVVFDLLCVWMLLKALKNPKNILSFCLAVFFCFAASFTKGFQGLFPLAAPFCYWVSFRTISFRKMILIGVSFIVAIALIYLLIFQIPGMKESFAQYFNSRLSGFPRTPHVNIGSRFFLLQRLFIELSPPLILCGLFMLIVNRNLLIDSLSGKTSLFFFLTGLTASLPLMFSYEQRSFYLITSIPFFCISLACLIAPSIIKYISKWRTNPRISFTVKTLSIAVLISGIGLTVFHAGRIKRDQDIIHDVYLIKNKVGTKSTISVSEKTWDEWYLHAYFQRYANISLARNNQAYTYFFQPKKDSTKQPEGFNRLNLETRYFNLYKKGN